MTDIIVIGAGGCGLMAALVAAKKGARVLILEKTDQAGGGTALSSRGIRTAGTRIQRSAKVEDWTRMVDVNIKGVLHFLSTVVPHMVERGSGHLVSVGSVAGRRPLPGGSVYAAKIGRAHV